MQADFEKKERYGIEDLLAIMALLRSENGCPWDREQTHASIRKNFIEETYEAVEAIDKDDAVLLREELGDVLLQVVFHAQMEKERGSFDFSDVCDGICKKLIVRHPHIFSEESLSSADAVHDRWEEIKKETKGQKTEAEILAAVPKQLPALMRAIKVQQRAERALSGAESLPWTWEQVRKTEEALSAAQQEESGKDGAEKLGALLFFVVSAARQSGLDPEECLSASTEKFIRRITDAEENLRQGKGSFSDLGNEEFLSLWQDAK